MSIERQKVFTADIHGRNELLNAVLDRYLQQADVYIVGDAFHPTTYGNSRLTNQLIVDRNIKLLSGNGEHVLATTMYESHTPTRLKCITDVFRPTYNGGIFDDYGIEEPDVHTSLTGLLNKFDTLRAKMEKAKHDKIFRTMQPFYEDAEIVAVHSGLVNSQSWEGQGGQKQELIEYGLSRQLEGRDWLIEPKQIFDPGHILSKTLSASEYLGKILITGHDHSGESCDQRVTDSGRRIRLGSKQDPGLPLFVYEKTSKLVVPVYAKA